MKKYIIGILILVCSVGLCGCSNSQLDKISKDLSSYTLSVSLNDDMTLSCHEKLQYRNNYDVTLNELCMHLYPNAFREGAKCPPVNLSSQAKAYPNGKSYGNITISEVKIGGKQKEFEITGQDENILKFEFDEILYPQDKVDIDIDFSVQLPNINHRFGYGNNTVNLANFFPIACVYEDGEFMCEAYSGNGDPFYSEVANFYVDFNCASKYVVASTGTQIKTDEKDQTKSINIEAKVVRDFAIVCSDKFEEKEIKSGDTLIKYYYYSDQQSDQTLQTCDKVLKTFNELFGKYPYKTMSVVEANFVHGGMEYPNLIYISDACSDYVEYTNVVVHEMAHQWWYAMVGNNEYENSWLDEGLTEYSTALFYEKNPEYEIELKDIVKSNWKSYSMFTSIYTNVLGTVDTSMDRKLNEFSTETEYVYMAYVKGMLLFDSVREIIGDKAFFNGLKIYFNDNKYKVARYENLVSAFEQSSGCDLENLFSAWIDGKIIIINQI